MSNVDPAALRALHEELEALEQCVASMLTPSDPASYARAVEICGLLREAAAGLTALLDENEKLQRRLVLHEEAALAPELNTLDKLRGAILVRGGT